MANLIFQVTAVSPKGDSGTHVVMHGSIDTKDLFKGPAPNSIVSVWPKGTVLEGMKVGKKYQLVEVVEEETPQAK